MDIYYFPCPNCNFERTYRTRGPIKSDGSIVQIKERAFTAKCISCDWDESGTEVVPIL